MLTAAEGEIDKTSASPKATSYDYGAEYQQEMERLYWESKKDDPDNHDRHRIALAERLIEKHAPQGAAGEARTLLDVGCSVGLFATHFSKKGFRAVGIDFDRAAVDAAARICKQDGGSAQFVCGDLGDASIDLPPADIALCFDIFEHLHDDELGVLLAKLKSVLKPGGVLVFHTLPMQYDYLFWSGKKGRIRIPLLLKPFGYLPARMFEKVVRSAALLLDIALVLLTHKTWRERIKQTSHCNPLTRDRLEDILLRAGYTIEALDTGFLSPQYDRSAYPVLARQPITHRSLWGVCRPPARPGA